MLDETSSITDEIASARSRPHISSARCLRDLAISPLERSLSVAAIAVPGYSDLGRTTTWRLSPDPMLSVVTS